VQTNKKFTFDCHLDEAPNDFWYTFCMIWRLKPCTFWSFSQRRVCIFVVHSGCIKWRLYCAKVELDAYMGVDCRGALHGVCCVKPSS